MKLIHNNNFFGYFKYIQNVVGNKIYVSSFLSVFVSMLDGLGLAMFIPLLQSIDGQSNASNESMGYLHYLTDIIEKLGFSLTLETILIILVLLFFVKGIIKFAELNYNSSVIQFFMKKVRHSLLNELKNINYKGFVSLDAGKIQNTFISEVQRMSQGVNYFLMYTQALFMLMTYVLFAALANYQFAILLSIGAGLTNLIFSRVYKRMKKLSADISNKGDSFNSYLIQAIHYFKYLKSTNYLKAYSNKLREVINKTEQLNRKTAFFNAVTIGIKEPMILLIVVFVILIQVNLLGGNLGSIILSLLLFYRALNFLVVLQQNWQNFLQNTGALKSVALLSHSMNSMKEFYGNKHFDILEDDIELRNVNVSYGNKVVLDEIDLIIPNKKTIALVGESGSGKTTIANVIMGLIPPDKGKVFIGKNELNEFDINSYRDKIGYISQDSVIFNDTIFNNITFWAEPTTQNVKRFWEVTKMASLFDYIKSQDEGYYTILGDNGILISGGQKQRISIARELFKNTEILILDEATSALDSETESLIQENIERLHGHYTMIIIAHRLSTIKNVDKIILLENGKVSNSGNFETMFLNSPRFQRMVSLQGFK